MTPAAAPDLQLVTTLGFAAASGLVFAHDALWVVADDGLELWHLHLDGSPIARHPLFPGSSALPAEAKARKKAKPDLEALCALPDGRLLALGSGSRRQRMMGSLFDPRRTQAQTIDLSALYGQLEAALPELNIEGAAVWGRHLMLAHRGNSAGAIDALLRLDLDQALADLADGVMREQMDCEIVAVTLGLLDGSGLTLTDLAAGDDGRLWFSAAAEMTKDRYEDGLCAGSVIGCFDAAIGLAELWRLPGWHKIEGLVSIGSGRWLLVADADDPGVPSPLLRLDLGNGDGRPA